MKKNSSTYGVIAMLSLVAASVLSYAWGVLNTAAYGAAALVLCGVFVYAMATAIRTVEKENRASVTNVDFSSAALHKAA